MVVGDDVAAWVDDEAGAQGLAFAASGGTILVVTLALAALATEEAVEEVLHITLIRLALVFVSAAVRVAAGRGDAATLAAGGALGDLFGVDVDDSWADLFDDLREAVRERDRIGDDDWAGIRGVQVLLSVFLGADIASEDGAGEHAYAKGREQGEGGGEAMSAEAVEEGRLCR